MIVTSEDCGKDYESLPFHLLPFLLFDFIYFFTTCLYYLYASNLQPVQSVMLSEVSRIKPLLLASSVSILFPNITGCCLRLLFYPLSCPHPFPNHSPSQQSSQFHFQKPGHVTPLLKILQGLPAWSKSKILPRLDHSDRDPPPPLSLLLTLALATLASIVQMTVPSTSCHRAFALAALCPSSSLQVYPLLHFRLC